MKDFLGPDFLLKTDAARQLYTKHAKDSPIFDYHCHLNPQEIAQNKQYADLTELWLGGDHYKWRLMRAAGVSEEKITGNAGPYEKFEAWAQCISNAYGNPLYHWSHMELRRYFGIDLPLNTGNAPFIWEQANAQLKSEKLFAQNLVSGSNVQALCTTDDPVDSLAHHAAISKLANFDVRVLPTWRPDKGLKIEQPTFKGWINDLEKSVGIKIANFDDLLGALKNRLDFFQSMGCCFSDHGLEPFVFGQIDEKIADATLKNALCGDVISHEALVTYRSTLLFFLAKEYALRGWVMQLHIGALRTNNTRLFKQLGPDIGCDSIDNTSMAAELSRFLDALDVQDLLPRTVLYSLNPNDNLLLASLGGCFARDIPGKIQHGSAWWFNDHLKGMHAQLTDLASVGLLSRFVGMLTDSRSFISYTRHDYFRRILCDILGTWIEEGEVIPDMASIGQTVEDICFNNIWKLAFDPR
ncbi:MAG: glucuronate isomerase [Spirochaetia bacterium]